MNHPIMSMGSDITHTAQFAITARHPKHGHTKLTNVLRIAFIKFFLSSFTRKYMIYMQVKVQINETTKIIRRSSCIYR